MSEAVADVWLPVPAAIFLLSTGDLVHARELAKGNPETLVYRADHALQSKPIFVPLDAAATEAQLVEARPTLTEMVIAAQALEREAVPIARIAGKASV